MFRSLDYLLVDTITSEQFKLIILAFTNPDRPLLEVQKFVDLLDLVIILHTFINLLDTPFLRAH